jgi:hypothetical protein
MSSTIIHHIFTHDMRWQDNLAIRNAIRNAKGDSIRIHGWICLDPKQLKIPKQQDTDDYRGVPGALSFLFACESLLGDTRDALGSISIHHGSVASLSEQLKKRPDSSSYIISCAKQYTPFAQIRQ